MAETAVKPHRHQQEPDKRVARPLPLGKREGSHDDATCQQGIKQRRFGRIVGSKIARDETEDGIAQHASKREGEGTMHGGDAGPERDQDARKADADCDRATPTDPFAEEGSGQDSDGQWCQKPMVVV